MTQTRRKTYEDFLDEVHREAMGMDRFSIMELLAKARHGKASAEGALEQAYARIEDQQQALLGTVVMPRSETAAWADDSRMQDVIVVRWRAPELVLTRNAWMGLQDRRNVDDLLIRTAEVWGRQLAESMFATVYPKPNSERELTLTLGAEERGPPQDNLETT